MSLPVLVLLLAPNPVLALLLLPNPLPPDPKVPDVLVFAPNMLPLEVVAVEPNPVGFAPNGLLVLFEPKPPPPPKPVPDVDVPPPNREPDDVVFVLLLLPNPPKPVLVLLLPNPPKDMLVVEIGCERRACAGNKSCAIQPGSDALCVAGLRSEALLQVVACEKSSVSGMTEVRRGRWLA